MRRWAEAASKVFVLATAITAASGCQMIQGTKPKFAVRPSSQEELVDLRVLEPRFALAVPEDAIVRVLGPTMTCTGTVIEDDSDPHRSSLPCRARARAASSRSI